jgi:hypothetical protein
MRLLFTLVYTALIAPIVMICMAIIYLSMQYAGWAGMALAVVISATPAFWLSGKLSMELRQQARATLAAQQQREIERYIEECWTRKEKKEV